MPTTIAANARTQISVLQAQYRAAVKLAHLQLSRLKKSWKADGLTEVEIHAMIPDRPIGAPAAKAAERATAVAVPATTPTLTVVPPEEDLGDDEATDEVASTEVAAK